MKITHTPDGIVESELTAEELAIAEQDSIKSAEAKTKAEEYENLKASAKAKLISGEALTEEEANTIVL